MRWAPCDACREPRALLAVWCGAPRAVSCGVCSVVWYGAVPVVRRGAVIFPWFQCRRKGNEKKKMTFISEIQLTIS